MKYSDMVIRSVENPSLLKDVRERLDNLTKPLGSLGRLEELTETFCLARGTPDARIKRKELFVFAGDHGITEERVAPYPREVTVQMVNNMLSGGAAVTVMCKNAGIDYRIVDMGVEGFFDPHPLLISHSSGKGTANFRRGAAMTAEECGRALEAGFELGYGTAADICAVGEMGIGNTSSASALYSLLLDIDPRTTVGRGTGASDELLEEKRRIIAESVMFHRSQWDKTPFDALKRVGGFEIAGMAGFITGCAAKGVPVVVDGFISTASALCARRMRPEVAGYLIFGHASDEKYHKSALSEMNARPVLDLSMRLGEGTGAVLAINIIEQALNCYHQMATFTSAGVSNRAV
ncbi:MAG: nicotinate-nucleotide--dimethylbenzimidazole phosphoribosyltransferase [Fibrobacter sp.]|nr:nicotinate-nucleotide--dimethylbenzimidazole phosphoribosyltransferase [Fibrobacter sp.]